MLRSTYISMPKESKAIKSKKPRQPISIKMPHRDYEPSHTEMRQEYDMPGATREQMRKAFFIPVKIIETTKPK